MTMRTASEARGGGDSGKEAHRARRIYHGPGKGGEASTPQASAVAYPHFALPPAYPRGLEVTAETGHGGMPMAPRLGAPG